MVSTGRCKGRRGIGRPTSTTTAHCLSIEVSIVKGSATLWGGIVPNAIITICIGCTVVGVFTWACIGGRLSSVVRVILSEDDSALTGLSLSVGNSCLNDRCGHLTGKWINNSLRLFWSDDCGPSCHDCTVSDFITTNLKVDISILSPVAHIVRSISTLEPVSGVP